MSAHVMIPMLTTLVHQVAGPVVVPGPTLPVKFRYSSSDPWAVVFDLASGDGWIRWAFARTLLADGLTGTAGQGDVIVFPAPGDDIHVCLTLSSPTGSVTLRFNRVDLDHALDQCEALVPAGAEHDAVDWDREWARLGEVA